MNANHRRLAAALAIGLGLAGTHALAQHKGEHPHHGQHHAQHDQMEAGACPHGSCEHGAGKGACPMLSLIGAEATVENTKSGAVVRLVAKDPAKVADLQRAAASMAEHVNAHRARPKPATPPTKP